VADSACGGELAGFAIPGRRQAGTGEDAESGKDAQVFFVSIFGFWTIIGGARRRRCSPPRKRLGPPAAGGLGPVDFLELFDPGGFTADNENKLPPSGI
jgi:hypothetical protein